MAQFSQPLHQSYAIPNEWMVWPWLAGQQGFSGSWHTRNGRAGCSQVLAHLHPAPHHSVLIKVSFALLLALQVLKVQHLVRTLDLAK